MKKNCLLLFMCLMALCGCYPEGPDYVDELDVVLTNRQPDFDTLTAMTYSMPNEVVIIDDDDFTDFDDDNEPEFVDEPYRSAILNTVRDNMENYGWQEVSLEQRADVVLLVSVSQTTNVFYYYDWYYWNWYFGGYYNPWGWYYPGYYYPSVSSYRTGSVFIQLTEPNNQTADDRAPVVWSGVLNGLLEGSNTNITNRIEEGVNKAFDQSPYLQR
ncbi:DUF4136 domain-containing protein [Limibacter armeniacum]|uniref:DUF4136 domain-containing protein n=1 Tax=Limibacter armeniacum TaxID=466084 RepID=UPI002FE57548